MVNMKLELNVMITDLGLEKSERIRTIMTAGLGIQFKLGRRVSLSIEDKWSY
jgi:hypothetical protein